MGRNARDGEAYFFGRRDLPWPAVMLSIVATETSTLTFLSIPGIAYGGSLAFVQIALGYVLGRIAVARWLLGAYREGRLRTAYESLEARFGLKTRRFTSAIFMVTRLLADSTRLFATAIPLTLVTGWPLITSVIVIGAATFIYTFLGGIRAVVWVDASQMALYVAGGAIALVAIGTVTPGGWPEILDRAGDAGKLAWLDSSLDFGQPYTIWAGLLGGAFLSMGSHGTDQLIVQRLLACRNLSASRRALVVSGFAVLLQFVLFLAVGIGLWAYYDGAAFLRTDEIFATFIVEALPSGVRGLLIAAIFAAAMSTLSSSINALSSATAYDFWGAARPEATERQLFRAGRIASALWTVLLVAAAAAVIPLSRDSTAVEISLSIASLVYGGLLGAFALARFSRRADGRSARIAVATSVVAITLLWAFARDAVAWTWFVPAGTAIAVASGWIASRFRPQPGPE